MRVGPFACLTELTERKLTERKLTERKLTERKLGTPAPLLIGGI
jgi:hypothetical protein